MNEARSNGGTPRPQFAPLRMNDFEVSWAGPHPLMPGFCFGSEEGRLLFTDENGVQIGEVTKGSYSREAINGVAGYGGWIAVSTRQDVTMRTANPVDDTEQGSLVFPHGAHGITATPSGYFVAPLGRTGIMMLKPGSGPNDPVGILTSDKPDVYYYRVLAYEGRNGKDLLVCASRRGGIGITEMQWGQEDYKMRVATFDGLDVVDVCAVGSDRETPAVAALARDGTLILVRDTLDDEKSATMKFDTVQGTAYRLFCNSEHLFVLTSRGLYVLSKLGGRLVNGMPLGKFITQILVIPMVAVDANLVGERWLLVITPDEVRRLDVNLISQSAPAVSSDQKSEEAPPRELTTAWQTKQMYCSMQQLSQLASTL